MAGATEKRSSNFRREKMGELPRTKDKRESVPGRGRGKKAMTRTVKLRIASGGERGRGPYLAFPEKKEACRLMKRGHLHRRASGKARTTQPGTPSEVEPSLPGRLCNPEKEGGYVPITLGNRPDLYIAHNLFKKACFCKGKGWGVMFMQEEGWRPVCARAQVTSATHELTS